MKPRSAAMVYVIMILAFGLFIAASFVGGYEPGRRIGETFGVTMLDMLKLLPCAFVLIALFGLTAGQAVVWYTGQFYALFFLTQTLKIEAATANLLIGLALLIGTPFFIFFGWLSDKIGRKPYFNLGDVVRAVNRHLRINP